MFKLRKKCVLVLALWQGVYCRNKRTSWPLQAEQKSPLIRHSRTESLRLIVCPSSKGHIAVIKGSMRNQVTYNCQSIITAGRPVVTLGNCQCTVCALCVFIECGICFEWLSEWMSLSCLRAAFSPWFIRLGLAWRGILSQTLQFAAIYASMREKPTETNIWVCSIMKWPYLYWLNWVIGPFKQSLDTQATI